MLSKVPANIGLIGTAITAIFTKIAISYAAIQVKGLNWADQGGLLQLILLGKGSFDENLGKVTGRIGGLKNSLQLLTKIKKMNLLLSSQTLTVDEKANVLMKLTNTGLSKEAMLRIAAAGGIKAQAVATWELVKAQLTALASNPIGLIILIIAAVAALVTILSALIKTDKERLKELDKKIEKEKEAISSLRQEADAISDLKEEYISLSKSGEDLTDIKNRLIDQFGPTINGLAIETASYQELVAAMQAVGDEKRKEAAYQSIALATDEREEAGIKARIAYDDNHDENQNTINTLKVPQWRGMDNKLYPSYEEALAAYEKQLKSENPDWDDTTISKEVSARFNVSDPVYVASDGTEFSNSEQYVDHEYQLARNAAVAGAESSYEIPLATARVTAEGIAPDFNIDIDTTEGVKQVSLLTSAIQTFGATYDEETKDFSINLPDGVSEDELNDFLAGFEGLDDDIQQAFTDLASGAVSWGNLDSTTQKNLLTLENDFGRKMAEQYQAGYEEVKDRYNQAAVASGLKTENNGYVNAAGANLIYLEQVPNGEELGLAYIKAFNDLGNNKEAQDAYVNAIGKLMNSGIDPSLITKDMISALGGTQEEIATAYEKISSISKIDLEESGMVPYFEALSGMLEDVTEVSIDAENAINKITTSIDNLKSASESMSWDDYLSKGKEMGQMLEESGLAANGMGEALWYASMEVNENTGEVSTNKDMLELLAISQIASARATLEEALAKAQNTTQTYANAIADAQLLNGTYGVVTALNSVGTSANNGAKIWEIYNKAMSGQMSLEDAQSRLNEMGTSVEEVSKTISDTMASWTGQDNILGEQYSQSLANEAKLRIAIARLDQLDSSTLVGGSSSGSGGGSSSNSNKDYINSLKDLADKLKEAADAAKDSAETQIEAILSVLDFQKESLKKQNDNLKDSLEKQQDLFELQLTAWKDYLQKQLDEMEKANEKLQDSLEFQAQVAGDAYQLQIDAIQEKINAIDEEAEAENRILELQKARDAYEKARNSKTRLVLTKGAGWIFKTDQEELENARQSLAEAERTYQKEVLQDEIDKLQEQADQWDKIAENISKNADEIEKLNAAIAEFNNLTDEGRQNLLDIFKESVSGATQSNANLAYNKDETAEGSLANQIAKIETAIDDATQSYQDYLDGIEMDKFLDDFLNELSSGNKKSEDITTSLLNSVQNFIDGEGENTLKAISEQISQNEKQIELIEETVDLWKDLKSNLGLSLEEISSAQELFNKYSAMSLEELGEQSSLFKDMSYNVNELIAKMYSDYNSAKNAYDTANKGYSSGGIIDYYGEANVHGTSNSAEVIFNSKQASALFNWVKSLSSVGIPSITSGRVIGSTSNINNNSNSLYIENLNIKSDADSVKSLVTDIKRNSPLVRRR